tara:strand:- start:417 stop:662 length:246 start_codon:yes stop_codon:yes gene_type:complete
MMLLMLFGFTGCQTTKPTSVIKIVERKVEIPESLKKCDPEPVARDVWVTQLDPARFTNALADAGEDCRVKHAAVIKLVTAK